MFTEYTNEALLEIFNFLSDNPDIIEYQRQDLLKEIKKEIVSRMAPSGTKSLSFDNFFKIDLQKIPRP